MKIIHKRRWLIYVGVLNKFQNKISIFVELDTQKTLTVKYYTKQGQLEVIESFKIQEWTLDHTVTLKLLDNSPYVFSCDFALFLHVKIKVKMKEVFQ